MVRLKDGERLSFASDSTPSVHDMKAGKAKLVKVACLSLSRVASSKGGRVIVRLTVCVSACDDGDG